MRANHARRGRKEKNPIVETAPSKSNGDSATSWTTDDERIAARAIRYVLSQHRRHLDHRQQEKVTLEALDELLDKPREGVADVFFTASRVSKYVCITIAVCVLAGIAGAASRPEAAPDMLKLVSLVPTVLASLLLVRTQPRSR